LLRDTTTAEDRILGCGIANQRETVIVWDRHTLEPLGPAIGWECRRTAATADALAQSHGEIIRQTTGLIPDAYFSGPKIAWLLDHPSIPSDHLRDLAQQGDIAAGTVDSWLIAKLTRDAAHLTDRTNASRTLCYDIHHDRWDDTLCAAQDVPRALLPDVRPSLGEFGVLAPDALGREMPILAVAGDQQSALFGQACHISGDTKVTYGTGAFLLSQRGPIAPDPIDGILTTTAVSSDKRDSRAFALEGSVFSAGSVVQWLRDELGLAETSEGITALAKSVDHSAGVAVVPAFAGIGAPHWQPHARGLIAGLSRASTTAHIARAALESIAFRVREIVDTIDHAGGDPIAELRVDGGMAASDVLLQVQADALSRPVVRPAQLETTALGVALMAGLVAGCWTNVSDLAATWRPGRRFEPTSDLDPTYNRWQRARQTTLDLANDADDDVGGATPDGALR
jgi:glycerol kinase